MITANRFILLVIFPFIIAFSLNSCESESIELESTLAVDMLKSGEGFRVGSAVVNINPENTIGISLEGYEPRVSNGINDTLSARCIIVADNNSLVALIALDLIGISNSKVLSMKAEIKKATGLSEENIFIHAIHTHSGPSMMDGKLDKKYRARLNKNTANATVQALKSMQNVKAIVKSGTSLVKTVNRRNPKRELINGFSIIEFQNEANENVASIINFSCHPVVLGPNNKIISADYVHYLRREVENTIGGNAVFFNGSLGNINPARSTSGNPYDRSEGNFYVAKRFGEELANDILNNYSVSDTLSINIRAKTMKLIRYFQYTYISILDLGDMQIAMIPGEPFESFGEEIKNILPGPHSIIMGLTNDYIGYIIPQDEWGNCSNSFISECYEETMSGGDEIANIIIEGFRKLVFEPF